MELGNKVELEAHTLGWTFEHDAANLDDLMLA